MDSSLSRKIHTPLWKLIKKECIKMMNFITMTLSFTVAILLASVISMVIIMQPWAIKSYLKYVTKQMKNIDYTLDEE